MPRDISCSICAGTCALLDVVDFNKSCLENNGFQLPLAGRPVYYARCNQCGFCFAPELHAWDRERYRREIYNADYAIVDPEYLDVRPRANAHMLHGAFGAHAAAIRHLDYGGGNGLLSQELRRAGWSSASYDPMENDAEPAVGATYELITAFEVFEHVPDPHAMMHTLTRHLSEQGMVFFTTETCDAEAVPGRRLTWWYAAPRNGHVSLYSRTSLSTLGQQHNLKLHSFAPAYHAYYRVVPSWARHLFGAV